MFEKGRLTVRPISKFIKTYNMLNSSPEKNKLNIRLILE